MMRKTDGTPAAAGPGECRATTRSSTHRPSCRARRRRSTASAALALDTETTGVDAMRAVLVGISLSVKPECCLLRARSATTRTSRSCRSTRSSERSGRPSHARVCRRSGITSSTTCWCWTDTVCRFEGIRYDTMIATYLIESSQRALNLKDVAFDKLGIEMTQISRSDRQGQVAVYDGERTRQLGRRLRLR